MYPASASVSSGRFIKVHWNCAPTDRQFVLGIRILVGGRSEGGEWQCPWRWRRHSLKFSQLVLLANAIKQHWAVKRVTIQTKCHKSHRVTVAHRESAELLPVVAFCAALAQHNWFIIRLRDITAPPYHYAHTHPASLPAPCQGKWKVNTPHLINNHIICFIKHPDKTTARAHPALPWREEEWRGADTGNGKFVYPLLMTAERSARMWAKLI